MSPDLDFFYSPCPLPQENTVSLTSVAFTPVLAERLATPLKVEKCDSILQGKLLVIKLAEPVAAYPLYFTKPNLEKELTIYFTYKTTYAEVEDAISWVNVTLSDELLIDDFRRDTKMLTKSRLVEPRYIGPLTQETDFVGYLKPEGTEMAFYDSSEIKAELHKLSKYNVVIRFQFLLIVFSAYNYYSLLIIRCLLLLFSAYYYYSLLIIIILCLLLLFSAH